MRRTLLRLVSPLLAMAACTPDIAHPTTAPVIVAEFDPTTNPPTVPTPIDLAIVNGHPQFPDEPNATPAQIEFNDYVRSLDAWPAPTPASCAFNGAIDPASVTTGVNGSVVVIDGTAMVPLAAGDYTTSVSSDGKTVNIVPKGGSWKLGHTYLVMVFGGGNPTPDRMGDAMGIKGAAGEAVVASQVVYFLRSQTPLLALCPDTANDACKCPYDPMTGFDPRCQPTVTGVSLAQAQQLEALRLELKGPLDTIFTLLFGSGNHTRENLVNVWSFTIAHGPFATFDPTSGTIPFPNDVLIDQTTGLVNLPIDPNASAAQKAIFMGLNTLDGFSTTASELAPVLVSDDNSTSAPLMGVMAGSSVGMFNVSALAPAQFDAHPQFVQGGTVYTGQVEITPIRPLLPDKARYAVWLTNDITDSMGRPLMPSPVAKLTQLRSPLVDDMGHSTVNILDDNSAKQLEVLRSAYAELYTALESLLGVPRDKVAIAWTFTTQTETAPLKALAAYPSTKSLPTDVTIVDNQDGSSLGTHVDRVVFGTMHTHVALSSSGTLDLTGGRDVDIPFLLMTPKTTQASPAKVTIAQHGLGSWRGGVRSLADDFAAAGQALIAIDINYHGARTLCTDDTQCTAGGMCQANGTCTTAFKASCTADTDCKSGGTCDTTTGVCSTGLAPNGPLCMTYTSSGTPVTECRWDASGAAFLNLANIFALRDNFRQHVLDLSQLARVVEDTSSTGLAAKLAAQGQGTVYLSTSKPSYIGQSLGGIEGSLYEAASPESPVAVLNVPGGKLIDLYVNSPTFGPDITTLLVANNVTADTPAYYQLLDTFRWIVDPGDPINFGRYIVNQPFDHVAKKVIAQEAGADMVIPNANTDALAVEIGLPFVDGHPGVTAKLASDPTGPAQLVSTYFAGMPHAFITDPTLGVSGRQQAVTWISSGGTLITPPQ